MTNAFLGPIIVDLTGLSLNAEDERRLAHPNTGGVILFGRNFSSRAQIIELISSIRAIRPNIIISIDHEGGRVQRFKSDGFAHLPSMRELGDVYVRDAQQGIELATQTGYILASELRAVGVDYSYTPVLDLDYGGSTVIGDRAFAPDAEVVAVLAQALLDGMSQAGMIGCGKHFPGHGFVVADSHVDMPVDTRALDEILKDDIRPYARLAQHLGAVMPAHVVYPQVDEQPAGFSRIWLTMLREELNFTGAIVTDDLSMAGAAMIYPDVVQRVRMALDAGCDMAMVCNRPDDLDAALDGLPEKYLKHAHTPEIQARLSSLGQSGVGMDWETLLASESYQTQREAVRPYCRNIAQIDPTEVMLQNKA